MKHSFNKHLYSLVTLFTICFLFWRCIPEELELPTRLKSVTTNKATNVAVREATLRGKVTLTDSDTITCGVIYGDSASLSSTNDVVVSTMANGEYSISLSTLKADATYYFRAFAVEDGRYKYGQVLSFKTRPDVSAATGEATNVKTRSATLTGTISDVDEGVPCGFIYGTTSELTSAIGTKVSTTAKDKYSVSVKDLAPKTTYYYRAYAITYDEYKYGEVRSFTTSAYSAEAVDLGLTVKWASCNVGADAPEEFGGLYAWGETEEKDYYHWDSYKWGTWYNYIEKYFVGKHPDGRPVEPDNKTVLEPEDDVAHVVWGGHWYMPTLDEVNELLGACTAEWTTVNGVSGQKLTGPNGNSIFFPAAGLRDDFYDTSNILECRYWSSSLSVGGFCNVAHSFLFNDTISYETYESRYAGLSVRPVWRDRKDNIAVIPGDVTNISTSGATLSSVVCNTNRELTCGFIYGITSELSAESGTKISTTSKGEYALELTKLNENTTYYYRAYVIVGDEYRLGEIRSFMTKSEASAATGEATNVTHSSVTLGGTVNNSQEKLTCGIIYGTSSTLSATSGTKVSTTSNGAFTINISSLHDNTTYYYCAYVIVGGQYKKGDTRSFKTNQGPYATTGSAQNVTYSSATLGGTVNNSEEKLTCGIIYSTSSTLSATSGTKVSTTSNGAFTINISSLQDNTTYYYCAYVIVDGQYKLGGTRSFKTNQGPYATTGSAQNVTYSSATLGGTVNNSQEKLTCGIIYGTSSTLSATSGTKVSTTSNGAYTINISSLQANTTYYYCAYVIVGGQYKLGNTRSFTTKDEVSVTTGEATNITSSSACLNGTINKADEPVYTEFCYGTSSSILSDTIFAGKSDGLFSATINDLQPSTTYYYRALAYVDGEYKSGDVLSFTTESLPGISTYSMNSTDGWTLSGVNDADTENRAFESYAGWAYMEIKSGKISRSVTLTAGTYKLTGRAFYRYGEFNDENPTVSLGCMFAGNTEVVVPTLASGSVTTLAGASDAFYNQGLYENELKFTLSTSQTIQIGYHWIHEVMRSWFIAGDMILEKLPETEMEPTVTTGEATNVTSNSVTLGGILNNSNKSVTCGVIYGKTSSLSAISDTRFDTSSKGSFSVKISNLSPSTTYYYRSFAIVDGSWKLGDVRSFTTEAIVFESVDASKTYTINGVSFTMIGVYGGTFTMGSPDSDSEASADEQPAHQVTLSSYYIGETEVTQALWQAVMGSNPSVFTGDLQRPVEKVSWNDCQTFISKLNELTGEDFRLPTEAEWEYAARGGNVSKSYKYSGSNTIGDVAWYRDNSNNTTHVVKTKQPNELGIYDMSGNVLEWCSDWYGSYSSSAQTNPTGPSSGSGRVLRGGSWFDGEWYSRVAGRSSRSPDSRSSVPGLRLVR